MFAAAVVIVWFVRFFNVITRFITFFVYVVVFIYVDTLIPTIYLFSSSRSFFRDPCILFL